MSLLIRGVIAFGAFVLFLRWFEFRQVYHPTRRLVSDPSALGIPWEEVWLLTSDQVRLHAWFFSAEKNSLRKDKAVLFCHGNGGNLSHRMISYKILANLGLNVLAFDYRGYGASQGKPSELGTFLDGSAAFAWLQARGFEPGHILVMGESLGGGVAAEMALKHSPGGLILQSCFTSVADLGSEIFPWLPVRTLGRIGYPVRSKLGGLRCPVLILHSKEDSLISHDHAEANFAAAHEPKRLVELAGDHNDTPANDPDGFQGAIDEFLKRTMRW